MPRLKVFCATSGFHDAIVAAPSRPAALKAWGARTDLFSMGVAREISDPAIKKKALARPGEVIRLKRGSNGGEAPAPKRKAKPARAKPPSRAKLVAAEKRLAEVEGRQAQEMGAIERELAALKAKRDKLARKHAKARRDAEARIEEAREAYQTALDNWPG
jgi:chromosome segregation ATPase